jgi:AcrR family transcriptional regulator
MVEALVAEHQPGRRHLSDRQAEAVERLVVAAAEEVEVHAYGDITMRTIAKRAGVATATAYTYFSSKDHLLAEVLWRRMRLSPQVVDFSRTLPERVAETVRSMGFGTLDNHPAAIAACTTALLADGPDVKAVRARIAEEIAERLAVALGPEADRALLPVLQITYTGAILSAGLGHLRFTAVPELVAEAARLMGRGGA